MAALRSVFVKKRHAYTADGEPWDLAGVSTGGALSRCIRASDFSLSADGACRGQYRRQRRFLRVTLVLFAFWLFFFFV